MLDNRTGKLSISADEYIKIVDKYLKMIDELSTENILLTEENRRLNKLIKELSR